MGLRIVERVDREYGDKESDVDMVGADDMAGGFLPEGYEEEAETSAQLTSGFFPVHDDEAEEEVEDTLEVDHGEVDVSTQNGAGSVMSTKRKKQASRKAASSRRRKKPQAASSDDQDEDDDEEGEYYV